MKFMFSSHTVRMSVIVLNTLESCHSASILEHIPDTPFLLEDKHLPEPKDTHHRSTIFYSLRIMYLFFFTASSSIFTSVKENRGLDLNPTLPPILKSSSSSFQEADMIDLCPDLLLLRWPPTTRLGAHCDPPLGTRSSRTTCQPGLIAPGL